MWSIWTTRNDLVFSSKELVDEDLVDKIQFSFWYWFFGRHLVFIMSGWWNLYSVVANSLLCGVLFGCLWAESLRFVSCVSIPGGVGLVHRSLCLASVGSCIYLPLKKIYVEEILYGLSVLNYEHLPNLSSIKFFSLTPNIAAAYCNFCHTVTIIKRFSFIIKFCICYFLVSQYKACRVYITY